MMFKIYEAAQGDTIYRIEEDYPEVGAYLYVIKNSICINDYLQNDVESCKSFALEKYGISMKNWNLILNRNSSNSNM